jgi:hypothetical protein
MLQVVALLSTIVAMVRCTPGVRCIWMGYHLQVQRTPGVHRTEPGGISTHGSTKSTNFIAELQNSAT